MAHFAGFSFKDRGWIGDWQITGKHGLAMTDDTVYLLYAQATPRRWTSIKQALAFYKLTQDGDDEGILEPPQPSHHQAHTVR